MCLCSAICHPNTSKATLIDIWDSAGVGAFNEKNIMEKCSAFNDAFFVVVKKRANKRTMKKSSGRLRTQKATKIFGR